MHAAFGCIYSNKDKNFKANHNYLQTPKNDIYVVSIVTKIRILKQITTKYRTESLGVKLHLQ